jgi:hypothetical protein
MKTTNHPSYVLQLSENSAEFWIKRLEKEISDTRKDFESKKPHFLDLEKDYNEYKKLYEDEKAIMDSIQQRIRADTEALNDLKTLKRLEPKEPKKSKVQFTPSRILKRINWRKHLVPILTREQKFIELEELIKMAEHESNGEIENNKINRSLLKNNAENTTARIKAGLDTNDDALYFYKGRIGLSKWGQKIDTDFIPIPEKIFINSH